MIRELVCFEASALRIDSPIRTSLSTMPSSWQVSSLGRNPSVTRASGQVSSMFEVVDPRPASTSEADTKTHAVRPRQRAEHRGIEVSGQQPASAERKGEPGCDPPLHESRSCASFWHGDGRGD